MTTRKMTTLSLLISMISSILALHCLLFRRFTLAEKEMYAYSCEIYRRGKKGATTFSVSCEIVIVVLAYCCHDSTVYYTGLYRSPDSVPVYQPQLESVTSMHRYYTAVLGWYGILIPALFGFQLRNRSRI
jgi:hypothetical protein